MKSYIPVLFFAALCALLTAPLIKALAREAVRNFTNTMACNARLPRGLTREWREGLNPVAINESALKRIAANVDLKMDRVLLPSDDGKHVHDRIVAANASLFSQAFFSEPLTNYAVGWKDPNDIEATTEFFAPSVEVPRKFEYALATNIEEFYSELVDDLRALRGEFKNVEYTETKTIGKTLNRGLAICVDLDEVSDKANWEQNYTQKLMRRLARNKLRRAIALLAAAATNTAKTWDTTAGKDPDQDVLSELVLGATAAGVRPNRVGYGDTASSKRALAHRAQDTAGGFASAGLTNEQLAAWLNVDKVLTSRERYASSQTTKAEILNNLVLMFFALDGVDAEDASNIKGFWTPCDDGGKVRVYSHQISEKLWKIAVEHNELTSITSTVGIRKFTVS